MATMVRPWCDLGATLGRRSGRDATWWSVGVSRGGARSALISPNIAIHASVWGTYVNTQRGSGQFVMGV